MRLKDFAKVVIEAAERGCPVQFRRDGCRKWESWTGDEPAHLGCEWRVKRDRTEEDLAEELYAEWSSYAPMSPDWNGLDSGSRAMWVVIATIALKWSEEEK